MPRIPNPISPLAQAFDGLTRVILSMPTAEEREMQASRALLAKSQAEKAEIDARLGRRKLGAMDGFGTIVEDAAGPLPAGPMPSGPPINRDYALANAFTRMMTNLSERDDLGQAGALWRTVAANAPGASRGYVSNAMLGAGGAESATPRGFDAKFAQDDRQHGASLGNQFRIAQMASERAAATQQAIADRQLQAQAAQEERTLIDIDTPAGRRTVTVAEWRRMGSPESRPPRTTNLPRPAITPKLYSTTDGQQGTTHDGGLTDAHTGARLPAGTRVFAGQETLGGLNQGQAVNNDNAHDELDLARQNIAEMIARVQTSPHSIGTVGNVLRFGQGVQGQMQNAVGAADPASIESGFGEVFRALAAAPDAQSGRTIQLMQDPNLPMVKKQAILLAYQLAKPLTGQSGQGLSNRDFDKIFDSIGDPTAWLTTPQSYVRGLQAIDAQLAARKSMMPPRRGQAGTTPTPQTGASPTPPPGFRVVQ